MSENISNDKKLAAWENWKKICSVAGCDANSQKILSQLIRNAFLKKFNKICPQNTSEIFDLGWLNDAVQRTEQNSHGSATKTKGQKNLEFWAHEFDCGIINTPIPENQNGIFKHYKDFLWAKKAVSNDPPLKVISGKLVGELGVINDIAEKYLRNNHYEVWLNYNEYCNNQNRKNKLQDPSLRHVSIDQPVGDDDAEVAELIGDPRVSSDFSESEKLLYQDICAAFNVTEIAFILAKTYLLMSSPEFLDFVQMKKTAANYYWNNTVVKKLKSDSIYYELLGSPGAINLIKKLLSTEKSAKTFLLKVENKQK